MLHLKIFCKTHLQRPSSMLKTQMHSFLTITSESISSEKPYSRIRENHIALPIYLVLYSLYKLLQS
nr:MAG TPA: hypothetical protein [Caudoviricetes sp.]